jgi:hypothetical protein
MQACYQQAQTFKNPKLQTYSDLRLCGNNAWMYYVVNNAATELGVSS